MITLMRKVAIYLTTLTSLLSFPAFAFAAGDSVSPCADSAKLNGFSSLCSLFNGKADVISVVDFVVRVLLIVAVLASLVYLILGGIKWVTSGGDKDKLEGAKKQIIAAIVGLVVALVAFFVVNFLLSFFGVSFNSVTVPTNTNLNGS